MCYYGSQLLGKMQSNQTFTLEHMRLTTTHIRGADTTNTSWAEGALDVSDRLSKIASAGVQSIGVLFDGCALDEAEMEYHEMSTDSSYYVSFGRRITANGYSFRTLAQPDTQYLDALGFTVAVCAPDPSVASPSSPLDCRAQDWKVICSSHYNICVCACLCVYMYTFVQMYI